MKNFANLLFGFLLLVNLSFMMGLDSGSFHPMKTVTATGKAAEHFFGYSVSNAGDLNNDGYDDVLIGAYAENTGRGAVYVIYGGKTSSLSDIDFLTKTLDPLKTGFMITGNANSDYFGRSVSAAGDIDNDGYDDIIVGAYGKNNNKGAAYVIYGGPTSAMLNIDLNTQTLNPLTTGFTITGSATNGYLGSSVSTAGDINNDGYDDVIIGSPFKNSYQGAAYVIYGGPRSSMLNWDFNSGATLTPSSTGFTITGNTAGDYFGSAVNTAGDIDNDGCDDIIIGAHKKGSNRGAAYVIYGRPKASMLNWDLSSGATTLNPLTTGFMITGNADDDLLGSAVSTAGDLNNDGCDDILIGAYGKNTMQGAAYIIYGGSKSTMSNWNFGSAVLDPASTGFKITGNAFGDYFGSSVSTAGDINKDGYDEVIIGSPYKNNFRGMAYIIYGGAKSAMTNFDLSTQTLDPSTTGITITGDADGDYFGSSVSGGDLNNDGYDDLIIGAFRGGLSPGAAYFILYPCDCPANCETCDSPTQCITCSPGYGLEDENCVKCPDNCETCDSTSSCAACKASYLLYQGECYSNCPLTTFASSIDTCQDCSNGCSVCSSPSVCIKCLDSYTQTTELLCQKDVVVVETTKTEIEEKDGEKVAAGVFEGTSLVGASLGSGSSLPFNFGLVAKIIRNFKYMALPVSRELQETFVSWKVASGFMSAPDSWSEKYSSKTIPIVFSRYGLQSAFLINFWKPFSMALIGIAVFTIFKAIEISMSKGTEKKSTLCTVSRNINVAASNFALTQIYSNLDDVLFYFILEMRSTEYETGFRVCSSLLALLFFVIGGIIIGVHLKLIAKYQNLKENKNSLKRFETKCENIKLIFKDFKDSNIFVQSFLMINMVRSMISSLIFATLFEYPMIQISFLFVLNILMMVYLLKKKSFKELTHTGGQIFCEFILFIANVCVFLLALFDHANSYPITSIENLGKCIIVLNYILLFGCAILLLFNLGKTLYQAYQERKNGVKISQAPMPKESSSIFHSEKFKSSGVAQSDHNLSTNSGFLNESQNHLNHSSDLYTNNSPMKMKSYNNHGSPEIHPINSREISSIQNRARNPNSIENFRIPNSSNPRPSQIVEDSREETTHKRLPRSRLLINREITKARIDRLTSSPERRIQDPSLS